MYPWRESTTLSGGKWEPVQVKFADWRSGWSPNRSRKWSWNQPPNVARLNAEELIRSYLPRALAEYDTFIHIGKLYKPRRIERGFSQRVWRRCGQGTAQNRSCRVFGREFFRAAQGFERGNRQVWPSA